MIAGDRGAYICNYCIGLSYRVLVHEGIDMSVSKPSSGSGLPHDPEKDENK